MGIRDRLSAAVTAAAFAFATVAPANDASSARAASPFSVGPLRDVPEKELDDIRSRFGGQLAPPPITVTRWHLSDLESAQHEADVGNIQRAAQLARWIRRDGVLSGVLSTTTGGLVRLPKRYSGAPALVAALEGRGKTAKGRARRALFDLMFPSPELALLAADGILLGVGVAEMVPMVGADYKVMRRLEPEYLRYVWSENRWYYASLAGMLPITPGDGRWILHLPGGATAPWNQGLWMALGRSCIAKEHAFLHRENYSGKLANPARVAVSPQGASEEHAQSWFQKVLAWGVNTTFGMKPGYDVKLVESNGRGYEIFADTIETSNLEIIVALGSSPVLIDGGTGFANADVHKSIRADVIKERADGLAFTLNTQGIPPWANDTYGADALEDSPDVEWDVTPPKDLKAEADSMTAAAAAVTAWNTVLGAYGKRVDDTDIERRFGVPIEGDADGDGVVDGEEEPGARATSTLPDPKQAATQMLALVAQVKAEKDAGFEMKQGRVEQIAKLLGVVAPVLAASAPGAASFGYDQTNGIVTINQRLAELGKELDLTGRGNMTIPEYLASLGVSAAPTGTVAEAA
jgi:hypothetical protein